MHPELFRLGSLVLPSYTAAAILAMVGAMMPVRAEARRLGWDVRSATWLVVWCTVLGFAGAHVVYAITRLGLPWDQWWAMFWRFHYGAVWFGGFLTSLLYCLWYARRHAIPALRMLDVAAFAVLIAQPIGRLGCLLNGCCYGIPSELPWAVGLWTKEYGFTRVHPAPIYEALYLLVCFGALWSVRRTLKTDGLIAGLYLLLASAGRFALEFLRGDSVRGTVSGWLTTSQFLAIGIFLLGLAILAYVKVGTRRPKPPRR